MVYLLHRPTQLGEIVLLNGFALHLGVDMSGHHYSVEVAEEGRRGREKIEGGGGWRRKRRREKAGEGGILREEEDEGERGGGEGRRGREED